MVPLRTVKAFLLVERFVPQPRSTAIRALATALRDPAPIAGPNKFAALVAHPAEPAVALTALNGE
jgi:hypothetical protein